jgi:hypothetical protein
VSGNNYKLIFLLAAAMTVASTIAFVALVPSHARPLSAAEVAEKAGRDAHAAKLVAAGHSQASADAAATAAAAADNDKLSVWDRVVQVVRDMGSMGADYYRMLLVICMYGLGHINEVRQHVPPDLACGVMLGCAQARAPLLKGATVVCARACVSSLQCCVSAARSCSALAGLWWKWLPR